MTAENKLTPKERAKLGGYASAQSLGADGRTKRATAGGNATLEKHGRGHFYRAALVRWGKLPKKADAD